MIIARLLLITILVDTLYTIMVIEPEYSLVEKLRAIALVIIGAVLWCSEVKV